ncbi:1-deoxy-D-xylulose 5-phosphate reductoisomerase [Spiroplasma helicoides]|uniref:1-deoxy-D-xylulose 5-phosphate reductoisomerase n=1 Tax=Spiroplasma helicoides TaxID=216938 RepID=A0A1B3SL34_9MOLU|nr:1-deoxy-D-xylulose-5-phosphate reductoisomerase [Spiroplasma helicoides]AOG60633.1 1-deoxy-D-xylulose 5-phosphate reductoisomerase [Spiroplasma helicoides]
MQKVVLFGASGNIGTQTLEILEQNKDKFELVAISIGNNTKNLEHILETFDKISLVYLNVIDIKIQKKFSNITFIDKNIETLITDDANIVINALSGFFGLKITLETIKKEKTLLNANKESLVVAGNLINDLIDKHTKAKIYPLDSEHCAIFQCLESNDIKKIYLTASGGPFRDLSLEETKKVKLEDALKHPNWIMGPKITIDSATMFNKAFEILEVYHLFKTKDIVTLVHPQSIIHSMVEFSDGSIKAQLSVPDMKQVINYFLHYPIRKEFKNQKFMSFENLLSLELQVIDENRFLPIQFAKKCINAPNSLAIAINAANEVCVQAFIENKISFYQITEIVNKIFSSVPKINYNDYNDIDNFDKEVRNLTTNIIKGD